MHCPFRTVEFHRYFKVNTKNDIFTCSVVAKKGIVSIKI